MVYFYAGIIPRDELSSVSDHAFQCSRLTCRVAESSSALSLCLVIERPLVRPKTADLLRVLRHHD